MVQENNTSSVTQETFDTILSELVESKRSIVALCKQHGTCWSQLWEFKHNNPTAETKYARARICQYEALLDELHDLEDEMLDRVQGCDPKCSNAVATAYKIKIDNLKWILSKLKPGFYGDKVDVTSGGDKIESLSTDKLVDEIVSSISKIKASENQNG
jgi:hypothetical protein